MTFRANLEAQVQQKGEFKIPDEMEEAYFVSKGISAWDYRAYPTSLIEYIKLMWHLQQEQQAYIDRKNKPKSK
jgi:hypothetical protein